MAEVPASILGITTFGAQVIKGVIELKQLSSSLKGAPDDVKRLYSQACDLQKLLAALRQQRDSFAAFVPPCEVWEQCHENCEAAARAMEDFSEALKTSIAKNKTFGSAKFVFKKDIVSRLQQDLDMAKSSYFMAQAAFTNAIQFHQMVQTSKIQHLLEMSPKATTQSPLVMEIDQTQQIQNCWLVQQESSNSSVATYPRSKRQIQNSSYIIRSVWLERQVAIDIQLSSCSWHFGIKMGRILSKHDPVISCVKNDDVLGLQTLLDARMATVYDTNEYGLSMLQMALEDRSLDVFQYLASFERVLSRQIVEEFWWIVGSPRSRRKSAWWEKALCVAQLLSSRGEMMSFILLGIPSMEEVSSQCRLAFLRIALAQLEESPHLEMKQFLTPSPPHSETRKVLRLFSSFHNSNEFWMAYGTDILTTLLNNDPDFLVQLFLFLISFSTTYHTCEADENPFIEVLNGFLELGTLDMALGRFESPIQSILSWHKLRRVGQLGPKFSGDRGIVSWLGLLRNHNVDIEDYIRREEELCRIRKLWVWPKFLQKSHLAVDILVIDHFTYDLEKKQLKLYIFDWPLDQGAWEFWTLIEEGPEKQMPGQWVTEDSVRNYTGVFRSLGTSRRKRKRYRRIMGFKANETREFVGCWDCIPAWNLRFKHSIFWPQLGIDPSAGLDPFDIRCLCYECECVDQHPNAE